jgi:hypothetical protein
MHTGVVLQTPSGFSFQQILSFIQALGWVKGVFAVFFFLAHGFIFFLYRSQLKDRQREIDRVSADNKE